MKSFLFLLIGFLILFSGCSAEPVEQPSGEERYADSLSARKASNIAWGFSKKNILDSSLYYANQALELANKNGFYIIKAYSLSDIGNYYKWKEKYDTAVTYLRESLHLRIEYGDTSDIISGYNNLALAFNLWEQYDSAIVHFESGLNMAHGTKYENLKGILLNGIGTSFLNMGRFRKATDHFLQSIAIARSDSDDIALGKRLQNLGTACFELGLSSEASGYFSEAESIFRQVDDPKGLIDLYVNRGILLLDNRDFEEALVQLSKANQLCTEHGFLDNLPRIYHGIGIAYHATQSFELAERNYLRALDLIRANRKPKTEIRINLHLAQLYADVHSPRKALDLLNQIGDQIDQPGLTQFLGEYYLISGYSYAELGEYKEAYNYRLRFRRIQDSIRGIIDQAQRLVIENERARNRETLLLKENELQRTKLSHQQSENDKQMYAYTAVLLGLFAVVVFLLMRNRNMRIQARALAEKKKNDEQLMEVLSRIDQQVLEKQIQAAEETSLRIGKDLHDNFGSKLAAVQMSLEGIRGTLGTIRTDIRTKLDRIDHELDVLCDDTRTLSHDLMDRNLATRGLTGELRQFLELIDGVRSLRVHFVPMGVPAEITENIQKEIIAIIRTLIENVLRHANASEVTVQIRGESGTLSVSIEDDGKGFDFQKAIKAGGRGLLNVKQRIQGLDGTLNVESNPNLGTSIMLQIPIKTHSS